MTNKELNKMNYIAEGVEYTPNYKVKEYKPIKDENDNIVDFELIGFELIKSSEEVYKDINKPQEPQKTLEEKLEESNKKLWDTVEYLLKQIDNGIPKI